MSTTAEQMMRTARPENTSPVDPGVTVVNADNSELFAELDYRNIRPERSYQVRTVRALRDRAESYAMDARKFADSVRLAGGPLTGSVESDQRYALIYRTVAGELRKVAASI